MKRKKLTLGLAGALVAVSGMAACNEVTYQEGVILEFTDSKGQVHKYEAKDLFADYLPTSSSASTIFNNVREVLIRNYFQQDAQKELLATATTKANNDVQDVRDTAKTNANTNGTSYSEEFSKLLASDSCENVDELFEKKLLTREIQLFENEYYTTASYNQVRDGTRWASLGFETPENIEKYGPVSGGYLEEKLPYHVSHILVKLASAGNNEHTQDKISESEATNLSAVVKELAGANVDEEGITEARTRLRFGAIAQDLSEDDTSAKNFGDLGIMDKGTGFVQEFKLGVYAYEALYNNVTKNDADTVNLLPSQEDESIDADAIIDAFRNRELGTIPYGAFVALGKEAVRKDPDLGYRVNENSDLFYPRNVLFNKYMNNHQIAVITPNEIPFNLADTERDAAWNINESNAANKDYTDVFAVEADAEGNVQTAGVPSDAYKALPGFKNDTTGIVGGTDNVLTNEKGQIVLAVRAGTSSYQGIHFIVVDRSPLVEYAQYNSETGAFVEIDEDTYDDLKGSNDVTSLSEYYTMEEPKSVPSSDNAAQTNPDAYYPFYKVGTDAYAPKTTFINKLDALVSDYSDQAGKVREAVKSVLTDDNTYIFEELMLKGDIKFVDTKEKLGIDLEELVTKYIKNTRNASPIDTMESFDKDWKNYMEYLDQQDVDRALRADGAQKLISEVCAIGYGSKDAKNGEGLWAKGGACYDGK